MALNGLETSSEVSLRDLYNLPSLKETGDQSWREKARCKGLSVDLFFPKKKDIKTNHLLVANSRLVCAGCPVRKECLQFAVDNVITHGMYGGVMPRDRRTGHLEFVNGEIPFTQVLTDFRRANSLGTKNPIPETMIPDLAKAINRTLSEVREMMKTPNTVLLTSGD